MLSMTPSDGPSALHILTIAAGAGVHEEFVFRLLLIPATSAAMVKWTGMKPNAAGVFAVAFSSLIFAIAHYLGPESLPLYLCVSIPCRIDLCVPFSFRGLPLRYIHTACMTCTS